MSQIDTLNVAQDSEFFDPHDSRIIYPQRVGVSNKSMVTTAHYEATNAGETILAAGGNAFDAAVASAFALGVCEPAASGLGGQTMVMLHDAKTGNKVSLDGSSHAPHRIEPGKLTKDDICHGYLATTVPSTPATLAYLLQTYGTKSLEEVLQPAIRLAEEGYKVSSLQHFLSRREIDKMRDGNASKLFLKAGHHQYHVGEKFKQPILAETLKRIAKAGIEDFYQGEIAQKIHKDMEKNNGLIRDDDLAQIPWPVERRPVSTRFCGKKFFTVSPPGAGRMLLQALNIIEEFTAQHRDPDSPEGVKVLAETLKRANVDRMNSPIDPNLYLQQTDHDMNLIEPKYAQHVAQTIQDKIKGEGETTHLSAMDSEGNMVSLTQSIERVYGSFCASPELGFLYNNYMTTFNLDDMTHPHYLRPGAVPWASVAPAIAFIGNQPYIAIGSPGSERIVSAIVQVLLRLEMGATPYDAVQAPRMHASAKGRVSLEITRMRNDIPQILEKQGFEIDPRDPYSFYMGSVQMVTRDPKSGELIGIADPRRDGSAGGPR